MPVSTTSTNQKDETKKVSGLLRKDQIVLKQIMGNETLGMGFLMEDPNDELYTIAQKLFSSHSYQKSAWLQYCIESVPAIATSIEQRKLNVLNKDWELIEFAKTPEEIKAHDLVQAVIYNQNDNYTMFELFNHMLNALPLCFSVTELNWDFKDVETESGKVNAIIPYEATFWDNIHFQFGPDGDLRWIDKTGGDMMRGEQLTQDKYIIHRNQATKENPYGKSILGVRSIWLTWIRAKIFEQYLEYCNRHGIPPVIVGVPSNIYQNEKIKNQLIAESSNLYRSKNLVGPSTKDEKLTVDIVEASGRGAEIFMEAIKYIDAQLALNILGQANTTNSDAGGSYARDIVAQGITDDLTKATSKELEATFNRQFIKRIVQYNFPNATINNYPEIKFKTEESDDLEKLTSVYIKWSDQGYQLSRQQIKETFGFADPVDEEDVFEKKQQQPNNLFPFPEQEKTKQEEDPEETEDPDDSEEPEEDAENEIGLNSHDDPLMFSAKVIEQSTQTLDEAVKKQVKKAAQAFNPISQFIENAIRKSKTPTDFQMEMGKLDIARLKEFDNEILNNITFSMLFGYWVQRQSIQSQIKAELSERGEMDVYGILIPENSSQHYFENPNTIQPFEQALNYFKNLTPALVSELSNPNSELAQQIRAKSFWITRNSTEEATKQVFELLNKAYEQGIAPSQWLRDNRDRFNQLGFNTKNPYYLENVFRTNSSLAYANGQYRQLTSPVVKDILEFWQYRAVGDDRTRPNHLAMDGIIKASDDPFWSTNYPPNGYQCRCVVIALSKRTVERRNLMSQVKKPVSNNAIADTGWQSNIAATYFQEAA